MEDPPNESRAEDQPAPRYRHHCDRCHCLGYADINGERADLFVCEDLVIARYSDAPEDYQAQHVHALTPRSSPFLLTALRLWLDRRGETSEAERVAHGPPMES